MKTIQINRHTRNMIEAYRDDGESINDAVCRLLKSTEPLEKIDRTSTNIKLHEDTLEYLKTYKSHPSQSHSDTIRCLLESLQY